MADLKISELAALAGSDLGSVDELAIVDDSASETKKITVADLIANGVTVISDDTIPGAKILFAAGDIAGTALSDGAVGTTQLADGSVTAAKLANSSSVELVTTLPASGDFTGQLAIDTGDNSIYAWDGSTWLSLAAPGSIGEVDGTPSNLVEVTVSTSGTTSTVAAALADATSAGQFLAGPTGSAGAVGLRTIDGEDLPLATATSKGAVKVATTSGLAVNSGFLEVTNSVTASATHHVVTYDANGFITGGRTIQPSDLPIATTTSLGGVQVGTGLSVDTAGQLSIDNTLATTGTFTKVTVDGNGLVTLGDTLAASDIPDHSAAKVTTGTLPASVIGDGAITAAKLANESTTLFSGAGATDDVTTFPVGDFKGQFFWDETHQDLYIYTGSSFAPVSLISGNLVNAGSYNASTNLVTSVTSAGSAAGFTVSAALPAPSQVNLNHYVVVDTSGTGTGAAPAVALAPPDMLLSQGVGSEYVLIDVSNAIAGQTATNISFIPSGDLTSTNVQAALTELETEKLPKAGGIMTGNLELDNANVVFEGATADDYETTLTVTDPTADRTITLPDVTGTVVTTGDTGSVTSTMIADGTIVNADINASAAIAVSKLASGTARQLLQTDSTGSAVEFTSSIDIPGTLDVTGAATFDSSATFTSSVTMTGGINAADGSVGTPFLRFTADTNTGIYRASADTLGLAAGGIGSLFATASGVGVFQSSPADQLHVYDDTSAALRLDGGGAYARIYNAGGTLTIAADPGNLDPGADIVFTLDGTEGARFDNLGRFKIGTTSAGDSVADDITVATVGNTGITIRSGTTSTGRIHFSDGTSGTAQYDGYLVYDHNVRALRFGVAASEAFRVDALHRTIFGATSAISMAGAVPHVQTQGSSYDEAAFGAVRTSSDANGASIILAKSRNGGQSQVNDEIGKIRFASHNGSSYSNYNAAIRAITGSVGPFGDTPGELAFDTTPQMNVSAQERMRITAAGNVGIGYTQPSAKLVVYDFNASAAFQNGATGAGSTDGTRFGLGNSFSTDAVIWNYENTNIRLATNGVERFRVTGAGSVGIGTAAPSQTLHVHSSASTVVARVQCSTAAQVYFRFQNNNNDGGYVGYETSSMTMWTTGGRRLYVNSTSVAPGTDNAQSLGTSSLRWTTVYATNGTINTSDANIKQDVENLDEAELRVAKSIKKLIKKFRLIDSVKEKGDDARIHVGVIAQEVEEAFANEGLDARRYAMFCEDTMEDGSTLLGIRYNELLAFVIAAL